MRNHKRKANIILLSKFICLSLTSCIAANTRNDIIDALKNKNIITKDYELLDIVANSATAVPGIPSYDYIFVNSEIDENGINNKNDAYDSGVIVIRINTKTNNDAYTIEYFNNVDIYINEHTYTDSDGNERIETQYTINSLDWQTIDNYYDKYKKGILGNKLIVTNKDDI